MKILRVCLLIGFFASTSLADEQSKSDSELPAPNVRTIAKPATRRALDRTEKEIAFPFPIALSNAPLAKALDFYALLTSRTVLQHPSLPAIMISLESQVNGKEEAAQAFEKEFLRQGISCIPDGGRFVLVVPSAMTNAIQPGAPKPALTPEKDIIPAGTVNFPSIGIDQVLPIYGELIGRKFVRTEPLVSAPIHLKTTTPVTKEEIIYALNTLLRWNNIVIVLNDDKTFTAVRTTPSRPVLPKRNESN